MDYGQLWIGYDHQIWTRSLSLREKSIANYPEVLVTLIFHGYMIFTNICISCCDQATATAFGQQVLLLGKSLLSIRFQVLVIS